MKVWKFEELKAVLSIFKIALLKVERLIVISKFSYLPIGPQLIVERQIFNNVVKSNFDTRHFY